MGCQGERGACLGFLRKKVEKLAGAELQYTTLNIQWFGFMHTQKVLS